MSRLTNQGPQTFVTAYFEATGQTDQSEGRGGARGLGCYDDLGEAIDAVRYAGVQGDPGDVYFVEVTISNDGILRHHSTLAWGQHFDWTKHMRTFDFRGQFA